MPANVPLVGIFWGLPGTSSAWELLSDATPLTQAEPYGDCLGHAGGHYEVWESWRRLGGAGLVRRGLPRLIALAEYEDYPRGRVVWSTLNSTFTIYADRRLLGPPAQALILERFELSDQPHRFATDAHYRSR